MSTLLCLPHYRRVTVEWFNDGGLTAGCRVLRVGSLYLEIHRMAYNLRVVVTDALFPIPDNDGWYHQLGYGWCYPKTEGYPRVAAHVWEWDFDPLDPGRVNPPGPWIKAVHSGVYREPGIGQVGPDGKKVGRER